MFRPLKPYQVIVDVSIAVVALVVSMPLGGLGPLAGRYGYPLVEIVFGVVTLQSLSALVVSVVLCGALAIRRLAPGVALGIAWFAAVLQMALGLPPLYVDLVIFGILYTAAAYGGRIAYWAGLASAFVGAGAVTLYLFIPEMIGVGAELGAAVVRLLTSGVPVYLAAALAFLLAWVTGALVRTWNRARNSREAQLQAEIEMSAEQERVRIARDMHDVVAHSLAVVIAQADGARYAAATDPSVATDALGTISSTARAALADVRLLLTQLRHSQGEGPQPTLADLEELYAHVRSSGVDLAVDVDPVPRGDPPAAVQLAVYRILQEALTNAMRHGDGRVAVRLAWHPDRVDLDVRNPLRAGDRPTESGHGLVGMGERASLAGGRLSAAARDGEFVVSAMIPTLRQAQGSGPGQAPRQAQGPRA